MDRALLEKSIRHTFAVEAESIAALEQKLDMGTILKIVQTLGDCKGKVLVAGCGTSSAAAKKIAHSLCCVEVPACYINPSDAVHGGLGMLQEEDVLILVSKGGNTQEIVNFIPACKTKKALLIGVTENLESVLAKQSDIVYNVRVDREPCPFNMLATASTLAVISAFDAVCIALMHYTHYTREQFSVIHPGGAVGARLLGHEK